MALRSSAAAAAAAADFFALVVLAAVFRTRATAACASWASLCATAALVSLQPHEHGPHGWKQDEQVNQHDGETHEELREWSLMATGIHVGNS